MNKKVYNTILLFTGFVLIGIIALQIVWVNNMMAVRKKELKSNTQQSLTSAITRLERNENVAMILNNSIGLLPDSNIIEHIKVDVGTTGNYVRINKTNDSSVVYSYNNSEEYQPKSDNEKYQQKSRTIVLNTSAIKVDEKVKNIDSLVQEMIFEMDSKSVFDRINPDSVRSILANELSKRGTDIAFEYAILAGDSLLAKSSNYTPTKGELTFEAKLFPNDIFDKNLKLVMYYPLSSTNGYLFSKMKTTLILTGLFTLGILIAFYLTIRTIKKQKKLGEMKNDFINNITHEFKTPIATSSIAIAALGNNQVRTDNEKFDYYTNVLKEENQKMNLQVEKVLQMAMMEKGKIEVLLENVNAHEILQQSIKGFELIFKENKVEVEVALNADRFNVKADSFHLLHAFNNIIDNAVKYKTENCLVKIQTEIFNNQLIIRFIDNGPGMSAEVQKNAFEKFYRGQKGNVHDVKGFGLGLSYAKNIIELCKGTIHLNSAPGKGTELAISLPLV